MELDPDSFVPNVQEAALIYSPVTSYRILHGWNYSELSQEDLDKMRTKLLHYDSLPVPELQKQLEEIGLQLSRGTNLLQIGQQSLGKCSYHSSRKW